MSKLRVNCFSLSIEGYGAGVAQDRVNPLGVRGEELHEWFLPTGTFRSMFGGKEGTTGVDDDYARRGFENIGAWIMGRNMFGPIRGGWPDEAWKGYQSSSSLIILAAHSRWRAGRPSTSSPKA